LDEANYRCSLVPNPLFSSRICTYNLLGRNMQKRFELDPHGDVLLILRRPDQHINGWGAPRSPELLANSSDEPNDSE
jgi:hypothetical protein